MAERSKRWWPLRLRSTVLLMGWACDVQAFVPSFPQTTCGTFTLSDSSPSLMARRVPGSCTNLTPQRSVSSLMRAKSEHGRDEQAEHRVDVRSPAETTSGAKETTPAAVKGNTKFSVVAATGVTGALLGWTLAHSLGLELDSLGALAGALVALGLLAQDGKVGQLTNIVGEFTLEAFKLLGGAATSSDVPSKVVGTVGQEILEVVELTSGAVTKGYLDSLPPVDERLEAEIAATKRTAEGLREQLEVANAALMEAKSQLKERAENQRAVKAAKATAQELKEAKSALTAKDDEIARSVEAAGREREAFDNDLKAAKADTLRFREIVESRADMDDHIKALAAASDTLEERVQEYEGRLRVLTEENDSIRADYSAEVTSMDSERSALRDRISSLEESLTGADSRLKEQREKLDKEIAALADELNRRSQDVQAAVKRTEDMQAAVAKSEANNAALVEKAAAEAARKAKEEEKARVSKEMAAMKAEAAAAQKAAAVTAERAEKATVTAEIKDREQQQQRRLLEEHRRATEALKQREEAAAKALLEAAAMKEAATKETADARKQREDTIAEARRLLHQQQQQREGHEAGTEQQLDAGAAAVAADDRRKQERAGAGRGQADGEAEAKPTVQQDQARAARAPAKGEESSRERERARAKLAGAEHDGARAAAEGGNAAVNAAVGTDRAASRSGLMKLTVKDLRERCKTAGVPSSGKKADLVERLVNAPVSA